jgi:hypothetical protein
MTSEAGMNDKPNIIVLGVENLNDNNIDSKLIHRLPSTSHRVLDTLD